MQPCRTISSGLYHTVVASDKSGDVYGFGRTEQGQLGPASPGVLQMYAQRLPLSLPAMQSLSSLQVACGAAHTVVLMDGYAYTMGSNDQGQLGRKLVNGGPTVGRVTVPDESSLLMVAAGPDYCIAVDSNRSVLYYWGSGDPCLRRNTTTPLPVRFEILSPLRAPVVVSQVSCGTFHVLVMEENGFVYSWGNGKNGRLGHGTLADRTTPTLIPTFVRSLEERVVAIAAGDAHNLACDIDGVCWVWGSGSFGRLGLGSSSDMNVPRTVDCLRSVVHVDAVSAGYMHSCVHGRFLEDAAANSGNNGSGGSSNVTGSAYLSRQLREQIVAVELDEGKEDELSGSASQGTMQPGERVLFVWGDNKYGKLGLGDQKTRWTPQYCRFPNLQEVVFARAGFQHTVALSADGSVFTWGLARYGMCGFESKTQAATLPRRVGVLSSIGVWSSRNTRSEERTVRRLHQGVSAACGARHNAVVTHDGILLTWGSNRYGQMGVGMQPYSAKPIVVSLSSRVHNGGSALQERLRIVQVVCGRNHTMALTETGSVFSWGNNDCGQLGLGDTRNRAAPNRIQSLGGTEVGKIFAGWEHSACVRLSPPGVMTWGDHQHGQLGVGGRVKKFSPLPLEVRLPVSRYQRIEAALGRTHTLFLLMAYRKPPSKSVLRGFLRGSESEYLEELAASRVYCTGRGQRGQLGVLIDQDIALRLPQPVVAWIESSATGGGTAVDDDDASTISQLSNLGGTSVGPGAPEEEVEVKTTRQPLISMIAVGENSSCAVERVIGGVDNVFMWGATGGVHASVCVTPTLVGSVSPFIFRERWVRRQLGIKQGVFGFSVRNVSLGSEHGLLVAQYNGDSSDQIVFVWGGGASGKLGIGNVVTFYNSLRPKNDDNFQMSDVIVHNSGSDVGRVLGLDPSGLEEKEADEKVEDTDGEVDVTEIDITSSTSQDYHFRPSMIKRLHDKTGSYGNVRHACVGPTHSVVISRAGCVLTFGSNIEGLLGLPSNEGFIDIPTAVNSFGPAQERGFEAPSEPNKQEEKEVKSAGNEEQKGLKPDAKDLENAQQTKTQLSKRLYRQLMGQYVSAYSNVEDRKDLYRSALVRRILERNRLQGKEPTMPSDIADSFPDQPPESLAGLEHATRKEMLRFLDGFEEESKNLTARDGRGRSFNQGSLPNSATMERVLRRTSKALKSWTEHRQTCMERARRSALLVRDVDSTDLSGADSFSVPDQLDQSAAISGKDPANLARDIGWGSDSGYVHAPADIYAMVTGRHSLSVPKLRQLCEFVVYDRLFRKAAAAVMAYLKKDQNRMNPIVPSVLSPMETFLGRLYLRPCAMFEVYKLYSREIKNRLTFSEFSGGGVEVFQVRRLMHDFADLLLVLYNPRFGINRRRLWVFLRMMVLHHANECLDESQILFHDTFKRKAVTVEDESGLDSIPPVQSLEWIVFVRIFLCEPFLSQIGELFFEKLRLVVQSFATAPGETLRRFADQHLMEVAGGRASADPDEGELEEEVTDGEVRQAYEAIAEMRSALLNVVLGYNRNGSFNARDFGLLINIVQEPLKVVFKALTQSKHEVHPVFSSRVLAMLAQVFISYYPIVNRKRILDDELSSNPNDGSDENKGSSDAQIEDLDAAAEMAHGLEKGRLIKEENLAMSLKMLKSKIEFQAYLAEKFFVPFNIFHPVLNAENTADKFDPQVREAMIRKFTARPAADELKQLKVFEESIAELVALEKNATYATNVEENRFRDILSLRSAYHRRIVHISGSVLGFLRHYGNAVFYDLGGQLIHPSLATVSLNEGEQMRMSFRLDAFHVDAEYDMEQCEECQLFHTHRGQSIGAVRKKAVVEKNSDGMNKPSLRRFSTEECLHLWNAMSTKRDIKALCISVHDADSDAWNDLLELLNVKRQECLGTPPPRYDLAHSYEVCAHIVTSIKTMKAKSAMNPKFRFEVEFGDGPIIQAMRVDVIDVSLLYNQMRVVAVTHRTRKAINALQVQVLSQIVGRLDVDVKRGRQLATKLYRDVQLITGERRVDGELFRRLFATPLNQGVLRLLQQSLRELPEIRIQQSSETVSQYQYQELVKSQVLVSFLGSAKGGGCCGCCGSSSKEGDSSGNSQGDGSQSSNLRRFVSLLSFSFVATSQTDVYSMKVAAVRRGNSSMLVEQEVRYADLLKPAGGISSADSKQAEEEEPVWTIVFDPIGFDVPIKRSVTFVFRRGPLANLLRGIPQVKQKFADNVQTENDHGSGLFRNL